MPPAELPEIREADASPAVKAIFEDVRAVLETPFVNLIHRYLATIPGALEFAWSIGRAAVLDGRVEGWVNAILREAALDELPAERDLQLQGEARRTAAELVAAYNRGNRRNVVIFSAVETVLRGPIEIGDPPLPRFDARAEPSRLPPIPKPGEVAPASLALARELAELQGIESRILPSLYLHLIAVPGALESAHAALLPILRDGTLRARTQRVIQAATEQAESLAASAPHMVPPALAERREDVADTIGAFARGAIPSMIVAGYRLTSAFA